MDTEQQGAEVAIERTFIDNPLKIIGVGIAKHFGQRYPSDQRTAAD
jgi:hypothetical protein